MTEHDETNLTKGKTFGRSMTDNLTAHRLLLGKAFQLWDTYKRN